MVKNTDDMKISDERLLSHFSLTMLSVLAFVSCLIFTTAQSFKHPQQLDTHQHTHPFECQCVLEVV